MACRCIDKEKCYRDISKLNKIKTLLSEIQRKNFYVTTELNNLSKNFISTFHCENMSELNTEVKKLDDSIINVLPSITSECDEKIRLLQSAYNSLKIEDEEYHKALNV